MPAPLPTPEELALAQAVQLRTFPVRLPVLDGFTLYGRADPAGWGSGDFYDAIGVKPRPENKGYIHDDRPVVEQVVLTLGDATGHGPAAALMATELRALLRASIRLGVYHRDLVRTLNDQLLEDLSPEHFITLLMGRLHPAKALFRWVSFGQGPVFHYHAREHRVESLPSHHAPLGVLPVIQDYAPTETLLEPGDALLALSDGYPETADPAGRLLGDAPLADCLLAHAASPPATLQTALWHLAETHAAGLPQRDDRTLLFLRRHPSAETISSVMD